MAEILIESNENDLSDAELYTPSSSLFELKSADVRGQPKSGRTWKSIKTRKSSIIKQKGLKLPLPKSRKLREALARVKELSNAAKAEMEAVKQQKKERRRENIKRKQENERKGEVVQIIKNPAKLKRMKKKLLRSIEKRDTLHLVQK